MSPTRSKRWIAGMIAVFAVVLGSAVFVAPSSAQAAPGPHYWMYTDDGGTAGGRVDFWTNGDIVQVCDRDNDGARVHLRVFDVTAGSVLKYELQASGSGVCDTVDAADGGRYNLPENHCFRFDIYLLNNNVEVGGSRDDARWRNYPDATANC